MAIGVTPKYTTVYPLNDLSREQFLVLTLEAAGRLGWQVHYLSGTGIIAVSAPWHAQVTIKIGLHSVTLTSISISNQLADWGGNKRNIRLFTDTINELSAIIPKDYLEARHAELIHYLPPPEADALLQPQPRASSHIADILAIFRPAKDYFITPIILNINLLVFVLMALSGVSMVEPDSASLLQWGANFGPLTNGGELWRLITACFLHIGVIHLLMNMYAFLLIGAQLEPRLGKTRFLFSYLLTGIVASTTSLWWHDHTISAGASGAIFGMYGVFLALLTTDLVEKANRKQLMASIVFFIIYNLLGGLQAGIDNAAHIGGLVAGIIIGYAFVLPLRSIQRARAVQDAGIASQQVSLQQIDQPLHEEEYYIEGK